MNAAFTPEAWSDFFVAEAGAAAALTGLLIVAISINLKQIAETRLLSGRAAETLILLGGVLALATFGLVPGQPLWLLGVELLAVAAVMILGVWKILYGARGAFHPQEQRWLRRLLNWSASVPVALAAHSLLTGHGLGLYW